MLGYVKKYDGSGFIEIHCPYCGHIENLDQSIEGVWCCEACAEDLWLTPVVLVTAIDTDSPTSPFNQRPWTVIDAPKNCEHLDADITDTGIYLCPTCGKMDRVAHPPDKPRALGIIDLRENDTPTNDVH